MIIPSEREYDWDANVTVGVIGGIPNRSIVSSTADADTYGGGDVDAASYLTTLGTNAIASGGVVVLPPGVFRIDSGIVSPYYHLFSFRGTLDEDGTCLTEIKAGADMLNMFGIGADSEPFKTTQNLLSDLAAGDISFTIADTTNVAVGGARAYAIGDLVTLRQDNLPNVIRTTTPSTNGRDQSVTVYVTGVPNSTTVEFWPPLPFALTEAPSATHLWQTPAIGFSIEDCILNGDGKATTGVFLNTVYGCWLKNVTIKNCKNHDVEVIVGANNEFRLVDARDATEVGSSHEGFDFADRCCFNLLEDSSVYAAGGVCIGDSYGGCVGNVIAYNFIYGTIYVAGTAVADIFASHGGHICFNLLEGNITGGIVCDGYHASDSDTTQHRNFITGENPIADGNRICLQLNHWSIRNNVTCNVIGITGSTATLTRFGLPNFGNTNSVGTIGPDTPPNYATQYLLHPGGDGRGNGGDMLQELDLNVEATLIFHGNYIAGSGLQWDAGIADHDSPISKFRASKPAFLNGYNWPPIDSANPPTDDEPETLAALLPAAARYYGLGSVEAGPTINSAATAKAYFGESFYYEITTDVPADTYDASGLPAWATLVGNTIVGVPNAVAVSNVTLTATDAVGTSEDFAFTLTALGSRTITITAVTLGRVAAAVVTAPITISNEYRGHD